MARTVRDLKLDSRTARARLAPSGAPHYRALDPGLHLGYRKGKSGGRWVLRWYGGSGTYTVETIGTADDASDADGIAVLSFAQAQEIARAKRVAYERAAKGLPATGAGPYTVKRCVEDYLAFLRAERKSAADAEWRFRSSISPALGDVVASDLTQDQIEAWRNAEAVTAPRLRTKNGRPQCYREFDGDDAEQRRQRRNTVNRSLAYLKAALNRAWRAKKIVSDDAWRRVEPFKRADAARVRYLELDECRRLINAAEPGFRELVEAALATGCRYGELAALQCRDFNSDSGTLHVQTSKSGKGRHVVLADEGIALFTRLTAGRPGGELVLRRSNGAPWLKDSQNMPMAAACERAGIEPPAGVHTLRHTWASHAVMNGAPLMVVAKNLGHSDTRMVERHYGHLSDSFVTEAIRKAAPRFGIGEPGNVMPIAAGRG